MDPTKLLNGLFASLEAKFPFLRVPLEAVKSLALLELALNPITPATVKDFVDGIFAKVEAKYQNMAWIMEMVRHIADSEIDQYLSTVPPMPVA